MSLEKEKDKHLEDVIKKEKRAETKKKLLTYLNVVLIVFICFGAFYLYRSEQPQNDPETAISQIKKQLPVKFDDYTTFKSLDEKVDEIVITIEKSKEVFENLTVEQREENLQAYLNQSKNLCSIAILRQILEDGKNIRVVISAGEEQKEQVLRVETCSQTK